MPDCTAPLSLEVCHGMSGVAHEDDVRRQSAVYLQHRPSLHYTPLNLNGIQFCHHGIRMVCINIGGYLVAGLVPQPALELPTMTRRDATRRDDFALHDISSKVLTSIDSDNPAFLRSSPRHATPRHASPRHARPLIHTI